MGATFVAVIEIVPDGTEGWLGRATQNNRALRDVSEGDKEC